MTSKRKEPSWHNEILGVGFIKERWDSAQRNDILMNKMVGTKL
jgi:hypothetical protein